MSSFLGQHLNRLDPKKRVSVPSAYRSALTEMSGKPELVLRPSFTHACIEAWPKAKFNDLERSLNAMDVLSEEYDDTATALYADAYPVEADKDGRILLPDMLVQHAGLTETVMFMGIGATFQIWDPAAAAARSADARERTKERLKAKAPARGAAVPVAGG